MKSKEKIMSAFFESPENTPMLAGKVYRERFSEEMREDAYYQMLGRLCKTGDIMRIAKGVYCRPQHSKFGVILPSEQQIINAFTEKEQGVVVGYSLYNKLRLTTQIPKRTEIFSSVPDEQQKQIGNIMLQRYPMQYNSAVKSMIQMLEVLYHYREIQELNTSEFLRLCSEFSEKYTDETAEYVLKHISYPKWTIAFLKAVLDYRKKPNKLGRYLSSLSSYKIPDIEALYKSVKINLFER